MDCGYAPCHSVFGRCRSARLSGGMADMDSGHGYHRFTGHRRYPVFRSRFTRGTYLPRRAAVMAYTMDASLGGVAIDDLVCRLASATGADHRAAMGRYVSAPDILDRFADPRHHIGAYTNCFAVALAGDFDTLVCCSDLEISVRRTVLLNRKRDHG